MPAWLKATMRRFGFGAPPTGRTDTAARAARADHHRRAGAATPPAECEVCARRRDFYAEIGTSLWRLRQKLPEPDGGERVDSLRGAVRHLRASFDILREAGVEIVDHTGEAFEPGAALKVIAFQPTPGLGREEILETLRPTIYLDGTPIQLGEVVVGTPDAPADRRH
jgi:hypothetical protein